MSGLLMKYFVLNPSGSDAYASASRKAMRAYFNAIRSENPELSLELWSWCARETPENEEGREAMGGGA